MRKRLQNRVAESRFAFPITVVYSLVIWLLSGVVRDGQYVQLAIFLVSGVMMMSLNNINSLIRIYSRMVSCTFMVLFCSATYLFASLNSIIVQVLFILFFLSILRSYQDKKSQGIVFYSFLCIGIASVFFVQILYYVPFLWILMASNLMAMSNKIFWSSVLGIITPYWFLAGYCFFANRIDEFICHFKDLIEFQPLFNYADIDINRILTFSLLTLLSVIGIIHFLRNSYLDKIRTRMIYEIFIFVDILTIIFVVLQPQHIDILLSIMIIPTSCLYAHYIALTKTRITNVFSILSLLVTIGLTVYSIIF